MANLGCRFVCMFGDYLAHLLIAAHTANNVDFGSESEDEGYESKGSQNLDITRGQGHKIKND